MPNPLPPPFDKQKVVAENRRARFDYFVEDRFEAGIALTGTEVKALRQGEGSIAESYAGKRTIYSALRSASPSGAPRPVQASHPALALYAPLSPTMMSRRHLPAGSA